MRWRSLFKSSIRRLTYDPRKAKYHFIHIPKNAGEAVRDALCLRRDVSLSSPFHFRYVDVADTYGRHLKYFAVIRNPWSRTASRYQFARQSASHWAIDDPRRLFITNATFADFVKQQKIIPIPQHPGQPWMGPLSSWFNQLDWLRDEKGIVVCECLRLEHLAKDMQAYFGTNVATPKTNVTQVRYDYRSMYDDQLAEIVADLFREDIDHFGFTFDGTATRNFVAST